MSTPAGPPDQRSAGPLAPSAWNLPNYLTVFRFVLVPVFGWLLLAEGGHVWGYRLAALAVFGVAMVTDSIDGDLARRRKQVTDFGKVADPIADKAMLGMALIGLSIIGIVPWWVTVIILVREVGVTVMRFVVIRHGVMPAGRGGKLKTALQTVAVGHPDLPARGRCRGARLAHGRLYRPRGGPGRHGGHGGRLPHQGATTAGDQRTHGRAEGRSPGSPGAVTAPRPTSSRGWWSWVRPSGAPSR